MHTVVFSKVEEKECARITKRIIKKEEESNSTTNLLSQAFKILGDRQNQKSK